MEVYLKMNFAAGHLDKSRGDSYTHTVYRTYSKDEIANGSTLVDIEELYRACPMPKEQVDSLLAEGKTLANNYCDVYDGKPASREIWDAGVPCGKWDTVSEEPANDKGWYDSLLFDNNPLLKLRQN